jgi:MATE family multidrug resistance protein
MSAPPSPPRSESTNRPILALALPIALANLTQPLLSLVDTVLAGHMSGPEFLGGVALGAMVFNFLFWGFGFLRMGTTGFVAQADGAEDDRALRAIVMRALLLAFGIGLLLLLISGPLIGIALRLLGHGGEAFIQAAHYCHARIWSAPAALGNYVVLGALLGRRRAKQALGLQIFINLVNIAVAVTLVWGLGLGVAALGAATAVADWLGFALGLLGLQAVMAHFPPLQWADLLRRADLARFALVNRDIFLRTLLLLIAFGWFTHASAGLGDKILAANALLLNLQTFMAYGLDGFAHAAEALVGRAVGQDDRAAFLRLVWRTTAWAAGTAAVFALVYGLAGPWIIDALTDQSDIRALALAYLPWAVALPLVSVWGFQLDGIFIGATRTGDLRNAMLLCTGLYLVAARSLEPVLGNHGLWLAFCLFMALRGASLALCLPAIARGLSSGTKPKAGPQTPSPAAVQPSSKPEIAS